MSINKYLQTLYSKGWTYTEKNFFKSSLLHISFNKYMWRALLLKKKKKALKIKKNRKEFYFQRTNSLTAELVSIHKLL